MKLTTRKASFTTQSANDEDLSVELVWSTGARVLRSDFGERYYEELSLAADSIDLSRLNRGAPLLNSHKAHDLSNQIGVVERAWVEGNEARAKVRFSKRSDVQPIYEDVKNKIIRNVSVGYRVLATKEETREGDDYKTVIATKWQPQELSLVAIPADSKAQIRREKSVEEVRSEERKRVVEINRLIDRFRLPQAVSDSLISSGANLEQAREKILQELARESEEKKVNTRSIQITRDERDTRRDFIAKAILHRQHPTSKKEEGVYPYCGQSLVELARISLGLSGTYSKEEVVSRAFHSTSDFPLILGNVAKQRLLSSYEALAKKQNFWPLVKVVSVGDFKEIKRVRLGESPSLKEVREGENFSYSTKTEEEESYKITTFGRIFSITRQTIVNDDLGAFDDMGDWGSSAAKLESKLFWSIFNENQKTAKGIQLFNQKNKFDKSQTLSIRALSDARLFMARQRGVDEKESECLDIQAEYLIVPPELQTEAEQFLSREVVPQKPNEVNPFKGAFKLIVSTWLSDTKAWYLSASREQGLDLIEMAYLEGRREPFVEWKTNFENDSIAVKARMDVGAKAIDYRGFFQGAWT
ncbi:MAG: Mu-like prophage major head subunit gpT family protein [Deltaproteobacteria bacterium]|nr:Mu-like prophage major head subunit gpT family protein [Deltaproteobacteria bacterium]